MKIHRQYCKVGIKLQSDRNDVNCTIPFMNFSRFVGQIDHIVWLSLKVSIFIATITLTHRDRRDIIDILNCFSDVCQLFK